MNYKTIIFLSLLIITTSVSFGNDCLPLHSKQAPVNNVIGDISYEQKFAIKPVSNTSEVVRIKTHLNYVEKQLRQAETDHLSLTQKATRTKLLNLLSIYANDGKFPTNYEYPNQRKSVFYDKDDRVCAVGYLVQQTAGQQAVDYINDKYKHASIFEMKDPVVTDWIANSGLSTLECAMIQPTYGGGGGWIIPDPMPRRPRPIAGMFGLEVRSNQIDVEITGNTATTCMDQVFYNPTSDQLQGYFIFPLPQNATIDYFSMFINGKETQGEVLDAEKARKIYQDIVNRSADPALLEYYNNKLFRVKIFPIQPRSEQRVKLTYTYNMPIDNGTIEYQFPLKIREDQKANPLENFSFKIDITASDKIKNIYCPTHEVEINRKGEKQATVGFEGSNVSTNQDLKVYYSIDNSKVGISMLNHKQVDEEGYFMLNLSPGLDRFQEVINKDITFVLDASGSMSGEKMDQAKKALSFCINNLNEKDKFNIIRFSTEATSLFESRQLANEASIQRARTYLKELRAIGGTNIDEALELALKDGKQADRPHFVVFLSDGKPTIGETAEKALLSKIEKHNAENTRIFTFGIGTELNAHLLDKLTEMTHGYRTYVLPEEDIEIKVSDFYTKVSSPILTDVKINFDRNISISEMYPKQVPDLFKGSTVTLMGRYSGNGQGKITLSGKVNGKEESFSYNTEFERKNDDNEFIPPLWAARCVGYLLDQIRLHGENKELVNEVVRVAKKHGIITPYTSYLIIEDEEQQVSMNNIRREDQLIRPRILNAPEVEEEMSINYQDLKSTNLGEVSVRASKSVQSLNDASNISASSNKEKKLDYTSDTGETMNLAQDISNIQGRAFYNNNNTWVDSKIQESNNHKTLKIQFNSTDYFNLVQTNPESVNYLALGRNVRFMLNNTLYEIYE